MEELKEESKGCVSILRIFFILTTLIVIICGLIHPKTTDTNLLSAILTAKESDQLLIELNKKASSNINIIFEADTQEKASKLAHNFSEKIDNSAFSTKDYNIDEILNIYQVYNTNLLSSKTKKLIEDRDYETLKLESYARLYDPLGFSVLPIEHDPFFLLSDYLQSLTTQTFSKENFNTTEMENKFYSQISLNLRIRKLSQKEQNEAIKNILQIKDNLLAQNPDSQIYITGVPIHSYFASTKSINEINLICVLSIFFVIFICKFYFKSIKILLPILFSLLIGITFGYCLTTLIFEKTHILTFVFSTTLIGICVDYSLHYFAERDLNKVFKSLSISLITTISAFLILIFSNIELLKQIATFTTAGLVTVYLIVVLFYQSIENYFPTIERKPLVYPTINRKAKVILISILSLVTLFGLLRLKFNDDIQLMYTPPKDLVIAESIKAKLNNKIKNTKFVIIKNENTQKILEEEENIRKILDEKAIEYQCISKFVPSKKEQLKNIRLRQNLYKNELDTYATFLTEQQRIALKKEIDETLQNQKFLTIETSNIRNYFPDVKVFMPIQNTSVMFVFPEDNIKLKELLSGTESNIKIIDLKSDISKKVKECRQSCTKLVLPIFLILLVVLCTIYNPKNGAKILLPPILATGLTFAILGYTNQPVSLFHILSIFLIIGFSIDYSVFRFNGSKNSENAVLISCATSIFSFFLLSLTSFKLISSIGFVLAIGLTTSYILSVLLISKE